jgi:hypothetical protein
MLGGSIKRHNHQSQQRSSEMAASSVHTTLHNASSHTGDVRNYSDSSNARTV